MNDREFKKKRKRKNKRKGNKNGLMKPLERKMAEEKKE